MRAAAGAPARPPAAAAGGSPIASAEKTLCGHNCACTFRTSPLSYLFDTPPCTVCDSRTA
jgi:hypothetical protein